MLYEAVFTVPYPIESIFILIAAGIFLCFFRPYWVFLSSVIIVLAGHFHRFTMTKIDVNGVPINLYDICFALAILSFLCDVATGRIKKIRCPAVFLWMVAIITIAGLQSLLRLGFTHETVRAIRWALQVPMGFVLGINMVFSLKRARELILALFWGSLLAVIQHYMFFIQAYVYIGSSPWKYQLTRTIAYMAGGIPSAFILAIVLADHWTFFKNRVFFLSSSFLFFGSLILNQTRSCFLALLASVPCLLIFSRRSFSIINFVKILIVLIALSLALLWTTRTWISSELDVVGSLIGRFASLGEEDPTKAMTQTRLNDFDSEIAAWWEGSLLFGRGLFYFQEIDSGEGDDYIAFGHLGYITYLSQLGLIGLYIFGIYFPWAVVRRSWRLWWHQVNPDARLLGLLGASSMISLSLMFIMSGNFLNFGYMVPGILYGSVWAQANSIIKSEHPSSERTE